MAEISVKVNIPEESKEEFELALKELVKSASGDAKIQSSDKEKFDDIVSKSKLSDADALKLAREVNKSLHGRYKKLYPELE